jgi:P-type E1-E2 ATPase
MKEKQFRKLNEVANRKNVDVTRNGNVINTSVYDLMVGDVVKVETGEILSVDGIVFNAANMSAN